MRTEDLKRKILKMFRYNEFYGYHIHNQLSKEGVEIELSRLYRVLNEMKKAGQLDARWEKSRIGPKKRMYRIGEKGKAELNDILLDAIATVHSFYGDYLLSIRSKIDVFDLILSRFNDNLNGQEKIAYLSNRFVGMDRLIINNLSQKVPNGKVHFIKPRSVDVEFSSKNLSIMDGVYNDVPLKPDYLDLLVIVSLPKKEFFDKAVKEWKRVLKSEGRIAILTPSILLQSYEDPLSIGDFVERYEHEFIEEGVHIDYKFVKNELEKYFKKIEKHENVHITTILA
jgi:DNA-binding PadR family transcriptional regulator